jgi:hypothetical protein
MTTFHAIDDYHLSLIGVSESAIGFQGDSSACLRFARAIGMTPIDFKGAFEESDSGTMYREEGTEDNFSYCTFDDGGFMLHSEDGLYFLSVPLSVWLNAALLV